MTAHWDVSWTLLAVGAGWTLVSFAAALVLGSMIRRGGSAHDDVGAAAESPSQAQAVDGPTLSTDDQSEEPAWLEENYGSRAASGMQLRAIDLDQEELEALRRQRRVG